MLECRLVDADWGGTCGGSRKFQAAELGTQTPAYLLFFPSPTWESRRPLKTNKMLSSRVLQARPRLIPGEQTLAPRIGWIIWVWVDRDASQKSSVKSEGRNQRDGRSEAYIKCHRDAPHSAVPPLSFKRGATYSCPWGWGGRRGFLLCYHGVFFGSYTGAINACNIVDIFNIFLAIV
jgi:hypothetical protein